MHMGAVLWIVVLHAALHSTQPLQPLHHPYLHSTKFVIYTDHWLLTYFFLQPNLSPQQLQWADQLADFLP